MPDREGRQMRRLRQTGAVRSVGIVRLRQPSPYLVSKYSIGFSTYAEVPVHADPPEVPPTILSAVRQRRTRGHGVREFATRGTSRNCMLKRTLLPATALAVEVI